MHQSVCVINQNGRVLMPTTPRKARILERSGKAKRIGYRPYTIQLTYGTRGYIQPITLGIDAGYLHIGFSAVTESKEIIGGELDLLEGMSERITEKARYRRVRRSRLRHRPSRFDNRKRPEGWLAPSIQHKYDAHLKIINRIKSRLPISKIIIELAPFDIQKIKNPDIQGTEYQQGERLGYTNLTAYIRHRDGYKCQNPDCKNKSKDKILQIHHLGYWKQDRSNRPSNLVTLCDKCHISKNHQPKGFLHGWQPRTKSFKPETFMSIIYRKLIEKTGAETTFGYITSFVRHELDLDKSHHNDAFIIAGGTIQERCKPLLLEQVRRHKRSMEQFYDAKYIDTRDGSKQSGSVLHSGRRTRNKNLNGENLRVFRGQKVSKGQRRIKRLQYKFSPSDLVKFEGKVFEVIGMQNLGTGVKLKNYPGVINKVVAVSKVVSFLRRGGICEKTK
jgi:RRXRR protein/HNH endonuclease